MNNRKALSHLMRATELLSFGTEENQPGTKRKFVETSTRPRQDDTVANAQHRAEEGKANNKMTENQVSGVDMSDAKQEKTTRFIQERRKERELLQGKRPPPTQSKSREEIFRELREDATKLGNVEPRNLKSVFNPIEGKVLGRPIKRRKEDY